MYGAASGMYGGMNSMMFGGVGGGGMMGSPYYGGMMGGPLSGLNQMLFSVQSVIFSLGQAVQVCHTSLLLRLLYIPTLTIFLGLVSSDCRNEYTGPSSTVGYCHIHV
jgi:hypothetical protein